jgi:hypothetical protein
MTPETRAKLDAIRERNKRLRVDLRGLAVTPQERVYENTVNDLLNDSDRLITIIDEQGWWKESAMSILAEYDEIAESFGGKLGSSKMENLRDGIESLRIQLAEARRDAFDEAIEIAKQPINTLGFGSASGGIAQLFIVKQLGAARDAESKGVK